MANTENSRGRLLCLLDILMHETDEKHGLSSSEIIQKLETHGYKVERKALYRDFAAISDSTVPLEQVGRPPRYFISSRSFEVEEVMILIDAVESANFMTEKKKASLISKLKGLTSKNQAAELTEQIHYIGRHHSSNNDFIYTTNRIRSAMAEGHPVSFLYMESVYGKGEVPKHDGMRYILHPFALIWNNGFYYCIGVRPEQSAEEDKDKVVHFRIDRMKDVQVDAKRTLVRPPKRFNVARHVESSFSMYGGDKPQTVQIRFGKRLLSQFYDRFDKSVTVLPDPKNPEEFLIANVEVNISPTFFSWISQYEGAFSIIGPDSAVERYREHLLKALEA